MNPIEKFESAALKALRKDLSQKEKALSLSVISNAITKYLDRVNMRDFQKLDPWQHAKVTRAVEYLKLLQRDINAFASQCHRAAIAAQAVPEQQQATAAKAR